MSDPQDHGFMQGPKRVATVLLPRPVLQGALGVWRRLYWWNRLRVRPGRARRLAARLVKSGRPINLELGSGPREGMETWVSVDLNGAADIQHDLTQPLPFPDASVERIYSSHVLEHFTYPTPLLDLLRECRRVLKPGGSLSVAVPNARIYLEAYFDPSNFDRGRYCDYDVGLDFDSRIDVVNFIAFLGGQHKFLFDEDNLPRVLERAGFRNARSRAFDPAVDLECRRHESIYADAVK